MSLDNCLFNSSCLIFWHKVVHVISLKSFNFYKTLSSAPFFKIFFFKFLPFLFFFLFSLIKMLSIWSFQRTNLWFPKIFLLCFCFLFHLFLLWSLLFFTLLSLGLVYSFFCFNKLKSFITDFIYFFYYRPLNI